jgi:hypothetical protein
MTKRIANTVVQSMRSPYKAYRSPFGPQYVFFFSLDAIRGIGVRGEWVDGFGCGLGIVGGSCGKRRISCDALSTDDYTTMGIGEIQRAPGYNRARGGITQHNPHPRRSSASPPLRHTPTHIYTHTHATNIPQLIANPAHRYTIPKNYHGLTLNQAAKYGVLAAGFGGVAGFFALFFFAEVPKVRDDIMKKIPVLDKFFTHEIPPEDNPF